MAEEKTRNVNMGAVTGAVVLLAIVIGLLYYYFTKDWIPAIGIPLLIIGIYEILSSFFRSSVNDRYGTNEAGAAVLWGFLAIAIGGAIIIYQYADSIIIPVAFAIIVLVLYILTRSFRKGKE